MLESRALLQRGPRVKAVARGSSAAAKLRGSRALLQRGPRVKAVARGSGAAAKMRGG